MIVIVEVLQSTPTNEFLGRGWVGAARLQQSNLDTLMDGRKGEP